MGPEPFFLRTLADLKICDYSDIFKTLKNFKERERARLVELQGLSKTGKSAVSEKLLDHWVKSGDDHFASSDLSVLPRGFQNDEFMKRHFSEARGFYNETQQLIKLQAQEPQVSELAALRVQAQQGYEKAWGRLRTRMNLLAQRDLAEMSKILQKLNLVEVEAVQRMHVDHKLQPASQKFALNADTIDFPYDGEICGLTN